MTRTVIATAGLAATLLFTGCHSDSDNPPPAPGKSRQPPAATLTGAEGSWAGTIDTPLAGSRNMQAAILGDGTFWMVYTKAGSGSVGGILQGTGTSEDGVFSVEDATLLSLEDDIVSTAGISASFVTGSSLAGTLTSAAATPGSLPSPATFSSLYQLAYNAAVSLPDLAGQYTGNITTKAGTEAATVTIDEAGAIAGAISSGCSLEGQADAETHGNIFTLNAHFGSEPACGANATTQVFGIISLEVDKATALAMDISRNNSFIFTGNR